MSEKAGVSDRYPTASPWPVFVALGFALTELGLFLGAFPIAVGGGLLFGGSVAGILTEADYVSHLWRTTAYMGVALVIAGAGLMALGGQFDLGVLVDSIDRPNVAGHRLLSRGLAIATAGVMLIATGAAGQFGRHPTA
ncbi:putative membrane protein [Halapricum desulfuricans]|uniref:Putative membrane protein n=1 Tax=Halapricum desulfuricans TaxID=2841257 RepID=A0A897NQQ8_9EURY|nr:cox cluster protein [Halapricum desulfuricans]QSG12536.1 putative membrane protein [Halapricum desulfuricans]